MICRKVADFMGSSSSLARRAWLCPRHSLAAKSHHQRRKKVAFRFTRLGPVGNFSRKIPDCTGDFTPRLDFGNHLPIVGRRAEEFRLEGNESRRHEINRFGEIRDANFRPFRNSHTVHNKLWMPIMRPRRAQHIEHVFGVAQIGEIRRCDNSDLVRIDERPPCPGGPNMWNV